MYLKQGKAGWEGVGQLIKIIIFLISCGKFRLIDLTPNAL